MLELDSPRWSQLRHAYGEASDIPGLLRQLDDVSQGLLVFPEPEYKFQKEPWFSLWSALCHQGDVYTASYAALPHVARIVGTAKQGFWECFAFIASIEVSRATSGPDIPEDLASAYFLALRDIPILISALADAEWDELLTRAAAAALIVSKGQTRLGAAMLELVPEEVTRLLEHRGVEAADDEREEG